MLAKKRLFVGVVKMVIYPIVEYLINYANSINSPIDIHAREEYAFRWSCENGYLP